MSEPTKPLRKSRPILSYPMMLILEQLYKELRGSELRKRLANLLEPTGVDGPAFYPHTAELEKNGYVKSRWESAKAGRASRGRTYRRTALGSRRRVETLRAYARRLTAYGTIIIKHP